MKVKKVSISQFLGIEELEFEPGKVTVIRGRNGQGKTSIIEAIRSALGGGKDATLLRKGAERGETVLLLDDGMAIERRVGKGDGLKVSHPLYGSLSKPQTVVDGLVDMASVNPVQFLLMPPKKRTEYLLELCPIAVSEEEITAAAGDVPLIGLTELSGLELIERNRRAIYEQRTATNGAAKEKRATIAQLRGSLPPDLSSLDVDIDSELAGIDLQIEGLTSYRAEQAEAITASATAEFGAFERELGEKGRAYHERWTERHEELRRQLQELETEYDDFKRDRDAALAEKREELRVDANAKREALIAEVDPKITEAKECRATLVQRAQDIGRHRNTASLVASYEKQAVTYEEQSQRMTAAIEGLDALKVSLMSRLPIGGVEIIDGELHVDGVPFDRANRARQVEVAFELAKLRAGALKLICVDNLECLDSESFEAFCQQAAADDLQLIVTCVDDCDLEIITSDGEVAA